VRHGSVAVNVVHAESPAQLVLRVSVIGHVEADKELAERYFAVAVEVVCVEQSFAEVAVGVRKPGLVRPHERVVVDAARRVLAHEVAMHFDYLVRGEAAAAEQVVDVATAQLAVTVAHVFCIRNSECNNNFITNLSATVTV